MQLTAHLPSRLPMRPHPTCPPRTQTGTTHVFLCQGLPGPESQAALVFKTPSKLSLQGAKSTVHVEDRTSILKQRIRLRATRSMPELACDQHTTSQMRALADDSHKQALVAEHGLCARVQKPDANFTVWPRATSPSRFRGCSGLMLDDEMGDMREVQAAKCTHTPNFAADTTGSAPCRPRDVSRSAEHDCCKWVGPWVWATGGSHEHFDVRIHGGGGRGCCGPRFGFALAEVASRRCRRPPSCHRHRPAALFASQPAAPGSRNSAGAGLWAN